MLHATTVQLLLYCAQAQHAADLRVYKTILVPLDGSLFAKRALEQARVLAATTGVQLSLLSVASPLDAPGVVETGMVPL